MENYFAKKLFSISTLLMVLNFSILGLLPLQVLAQTTAIPPSVAPAQTTAARCAAFQSQFTLSSGVNIISSGATSNGSISFCSASQLITAVISYLLGFSGIVTILFLIIGGFMYVTSGGNEEQSEKGKKILVNAVIGLVIITMSYAIVRIVASTLALK